LYLNAHTVLNTSSPCQFSGRDFARVSGRSEKISGVSWLDTVVTATAALAAMRAAVERGDVDEAARRGALAGPAVVERALRSADQATQLAGTAAAPIVEDRAELLAPLAKLAAGADRRTALSAAEAARAIARELARGGRPDDVAPGDIAAGQIAWADLALRSDRWIELRTCALEAAVALDPAGTGVDLDAALRDLDPAFRRAVTAAVALPVPAAAITALAGAVAHDTDGLAALGAAQSLCLSLESGPGAGPILGALGPDGLARIRALVARRPAGALASTVRDAGRCLARGRRSTPAAKPRTRR
jgi:hypothetical protein